MLLFSDRINLKRMYSETARPIFRNRKLLNRTEFAFGTNLAVKIIVKPRRNFLILNFINNNRLKI